MIFENRQQAGKQLASKLLNFREENPIVLALPRGGVPIGYEIAKILQAPLDVLIVRKIGISGNKEFGLGAIAEGGVKILDEISNLSLGIDQDEINTTVELEEKELQRRIDIYRNGKQLPDLKGQTVILVDDGMATGMTARAAIEAVKKLNPKKIILAIPVCARDTVEALRSKLDGILCLATPFQFMAVGLWYRDFEQLSDKEVVKLLQESRKLPIESSSKKGIDHSEPEISLHKLK